ncbi:IS1096 element passenger TnpR family protein [Desulfogranum mediterraneum]|uniref:IS1096 element passenger TnpR family protein n=1 Tax=Desulfogranum mediterraneum TaxID=160661 RepID=UPI0009FDD21E|nr:hypothetical protein [Desulfogranum mediterraneum]
MIWTIKVVLWSGFCDEISWEAKIAIDSSSTLDELHFAIQEYVQFGNDHLYEFYTSRNERSHKRTRYSEENELVYETTLEMLYPLKKGNSLFYLFDYGDLWIFKIAKTRKKPFDPVVGVGYPILIEESGNKPIQYSGFEE